MVEHENSTLRAVAWSEAFPWLSIVRSFRIAIVLRVLLLGAIGLLATAIGWAVVGMLFGTDQPATDWLHPFTESPWKAVTGAVPDRPMLSADGIEDFCELDDLSPITPWTLLNAPAIEGLKRTSISIRGVASVLCCGLWGVAVWALFGAAICRTAAVQLAADEQVGLMAALRWAIKKWPAYCAAPLLPVGGVLLAAVPVAVLGFLMKANLGLLLVGLAWPLALAAGLFMAVLLLGLLFGWPLMWAAISAEGTDSFDALSRSYAYTFQRPLHYLFYAAVAGAIGWLGWVLVQNFAAGVVWMSHWAAGWGGAAPEDPNRIGRAGLVLIQFWTDCVKLLAVGYLFSYFWSASAAVYFLLRRDVDATETDEVYLDADQSEPAFDLPPVGTDSNGAPEVVDQQNGES